MYQPRNDGRPGPPPPLAHPMPPQAPHPSYPVPYDPPPYTAPGYPPPPSGVPLPAPPAPLHSNPYGQPEASYGQPQPRHQAPLPPPPSPLPPPPPPPLVVGNPPPAYAPPPPPPSGHHHAPSHPPYRGHAAPTEPAQHTTHESRRQAAPASTRRLDDNWGEKWEDRDDDDDDDDEDDRRGRGSYNQRGSSGHGSYHSQRKHPQDMQKEDWAFYCEPCDKGFYNKAKYMEHCEEHLYCPVPGCNFLCRREYKLELHKVLLHDRNNVNLEDTEKYLAERKKRYPTVVKQEEARKIRDLKRQRGELEREARAGKGAAGKGGKGGKGGKSGREDERQSRPHLYYRCKRCGRSGHYTEHCQQESQPLKGFKRAHSAEPPEESSARMPPPGLPEEGDVPPAKRPCTDADAPSEEPARAAPAQLTAEEEKLLAEDRKKHRLERSKAALMHAKRRKKPSLWEKLVRSEVLGEKSLALQCLRYFVKTDFLEKEIDWVAFVAHSTGDAVVEEDELVRPAAVRLVAGCEDGPRTYPGERVGDASGANNDTNDGADNASEASSTSASSTSSSSSEDGEAEKCDAPPPAGQTAQPPSILSELELARQRVAMLESQLRDGAQQEAAAPEQIYSL